MPYDLYELCDAARAEITVPSYPRAAIRAKAVQPPVRRPRKRGFLTAILAGLSLAAIAAAAQIAVQSHVRPTRSGGFVISSTAKMGSRPIHSDAEIAQAARRLDFPAVLPAGLPRGAKPVRLFSAGEDLLAITYDVPGAAHGQLWIFLANPATMGAYRTPLDRARTGRATRALVWRAGGEQVIAVSRGLSSAALQRIKVAMLQQAR